MIRFNEKIIYIKLKNKKVSNKDKISLAKIGSVTILSDTIEIIFKLNQTSLKNIIKTLYNSNLDILDLSTKDISLEDVFINMTSDK